MQVWTYPEKRYEELGARRLELEWHVMTAAALKRLAVDEDYEWDVDCDILARVEYFALGERAKAVRRAKKIIKSGVTAFGSCTITEKVVDWYVEEDRVAEWVNVVEPEYVP